MRLIDADDLLAEYDRVHVGPPCEARKLIEEAPTIDAIPLPCPVGSDFWWVDTDDMSVNHEKGGIQGFEIRDNGILYALDPCLEELEVHSETCCLTREEAEEFREKLRKNQIEKDDVTSFTFPCPIGSDYWYVEPEKLEVRCVKGGIRGFAYHDGQTFAIVDPSCDMLELHDRWCCLTREEAEMFREQLLSAK